MLARSIEAAGISTVLVTMMPYWAEKLGVPRALGIEFPFGHPLGHAGDAAEQMRSIRAALAVLRDAEGPGTVAHLDATWDDFDRWKREWQPEEPSPIIKMLRERAQAGRQAQGS